MKGYKSEKDIEESDGTFKKYLESKNIEFTTRHIVENIK